MNEAHWAVWGGGPGGVLASAAGSFSGMACSLSQASSAQTNERKWSIGNS